MHDPVSRRSFRSIPLACLARAHVTRSQTFAATTEHNTPWSSCRSPLARTTFCFAGGAFYFVCPERPSPRWRRLLCPSSQARSPTVPDKDGSVTNTEEPNIKTPIPSSIQLQFDRV